MDNKTKGRLGEVKILAHFIEQGYEPYLPFVDNAVYDLLVCKDKVVQKVSIKYTSFSENNTSWKVDLRNCYSNTAKTTIKLFDYDSVDLLAVYVQPEDRVVVIPVTFTNTHSLNILKNKPL